MFRYELGIPEDKFPKIGEMRAITLLGGGGGAIVADATASLSADSLSEEL